MGASVGQRAMNTCSRGNGGGVNSRYVGAVISEHDNGQKGHMVNDPGPAKTGRTRRGYNKSDIVCREERVGVTELQAGGRRTIESGVFF